MALAAAAGPRRALALRLLAAAAALGLGSAQRHDLFQGVSYGPVPLKEDDRGRIGSLPQDDWMADAAVPMWGRAGRGDLRVIRDLGANLVRLYGNNPENDHTNFLDAAHAEGLWVFPGMSDWPYTQMAPGTRCMDTQFDCYEQIKPMYAMNLEKGFLTPSKEYHPSLKVVNIINEPDLKLPSNADIVPSAEDGPMLMARGIISALDAMLDAEKDAQVTGPLVNFTATFSYAICMGCTRFSTAPALGQMWQLDDAMKNPKKYGYTPRNNITEAYRTRWTHSFNTQNPATDLQHQFLDGYEATFPATPVYIGEYHRVNANQTEDLGLILQHAKQSSLFLGISFFQYQVAYWKGGTEMDFGMFGLGDHVFADMDYFGQNYDVHCLRPEDSPLSGGSVSSAVARVYGGPGPVESELCLPSPWGVPLDGKGYKEIVSQESQPRMAEFLRRMTEHRGLKVTDADGLWAFAADLLHDGAPFGKAVSQLASVPEWAEKDPLARCVADRDAPPTVVSEAIGWVCERATGFSCLDVTKECNSTYLLGNYVFSRYYEGLGSSGDPMEDCSFGGAARFAASSTYLAATGAGLCVDGASGLPTPTPSATPVPTPSPAPAPTPTPRPHQDLKPSHGSTTAEPTSSGTRHLDIVPAEDEGHPATSSGARLWPSLLAAAAALPWLA